ncbi:MAG: ROK family protein, partial [Alistipes sp.]|nr:ROK family protein [Alistipes sp.]
MKKLAMGIDIGGTNTAFGLVDEEGTIFCESAISTERYKKFDDYENYVKTLCESMKALISSVSFDFELIGIGIGAPNANYHKGTIETPANLWKFRDDEPNPDESRRMFYFVDDVKKYFPGVQVLITNDANAAAIGEGVFGSAKGMDDYVVITLGTGLGSGIVSNGEMIYGHDGFAGEYGHIMVDSRVTGRECGCGRRGCLEAYASATGIKRTAFELMAKMNNDSELRDTPFSKFEAVMLSMAADKGDAIAKEAFRYTGEVLGKALADLVATTSPKAIILFG